ncbi:MAG: aminopeptidase P family protein [Desulfobacteraceae bacterium]|nr:aminopeptidase P family protein [Desulfobacteraceae bacterium]
MRLEFQRAEYLQRHARAVELMGQKGLDGLLVTAEANYTYFSGFRHFAPWTTFTRPVLLILSRDRDPVLIVQGFQREDASRDSWITDVRGYPGMLGVPFETVKEVLGELQLLGKRIGAELGYEQRLGVSHNDFVRMQELLDGTQFVDASNLLWKLRMVKSEAEIEAHRRACEVATKAFEYCFSQAREGTTEKEAAQMATKVIVEEGAELGFTIICSGPGNYDRVAGMPTDRALRRGDMLWFDMGVVSNGYWCDFCRAGVVGRATDEQKRLQDIINWITDKGIEAVRPGSIASDVAKACGAEAERLGLDFTFEAGRLGHGMGLMSTEPPHIAVYDQTALEPGMVITLEPGVVSEQGAFIAEQNLVVTPEGAETLSLASRELRTL